MTDPVLRAKNRVHQDESGKVWARTRFVVYGGLHYIKGNAAPYFSLTYWEKGPRFGESGGAGHGEILNEYPELADLAALHLCDHDGAPMHCVENGFYHLGGTEWRAFDAGAVAQHFRITEEQALDLALVVFGHYWSPTVGSIAPPSAAKECKARLNAWVDTQRGRWKAEADACIAKHKLVVYGDKWEG